MPFSDIVGHEQAKALLQSAIGRNRLAHAYLFHGPDRIGKRQLTIRLAQALLCDQPLTSPSDGCGLCRGCRQVEAQIHPDYTVIRPDPEQTTPQIKIEDIRNIEHQLVYRPLIADRKICVIDDADRMTIGAANALLKTLEEPPDHSLFLLITSRLSALPATIRSRCQAVRLTPPSRTQVEAAVILRRHLPPSDAQFLAIVSEGQIGRALEWDLAAEKSRRQELASLLSPRALKSVESALTAAETLAKSDRAGEALAWLQGWLRDMLLLTLTGRSDDMLDPGHGGIPESPTAAMNIDALIDLLDDIDELERQGHRHLNLHIALENLLLRVRSLWHDGSPPAGPRNRAALPR